MWSDSHKDPSKDLRKLLERRPALPLSFFLFLFSLSLSLPLSLSLSLSLRGRRPSPHHNRNGCGHPPSLRQNKKNGLGSPSHPFRQSGDANPSFRGGEGGWLSPHHLRDDWRWSSFSLSLPTYIYIYICIYNNKEEWRWPSVPARIRLLQERMEVAIPLSFFFWTDWYFRFSLLKLGREDIVSPSP